MAQTARETSGTFEAVIQALSQPSSWPGAPHVEVRQTHASVVFLVGQRVYKLKRPVDLGFLDYSTLERRHRSCLDEVRLNTPRAPGVYLGVVPIVRTGAGFGVGAEGEIVEYAVEMVRLPDEACLLHRLEKGQVTVAEMVRLGCVLAELHQAAARGPEMARYATREVVARLALDNLEQSAPEVGLTVHPRVHARLRQLLLRELERVGPLLEQRARSGVPCDTHGDLRLDHVYFLPDRVVLVDCIEFSEALRYADPVSDLAFLTMDLRVRGEHFLAERLVATWQLATGDVRGVELLPWYESYRSAVRAKVAGILLRDLPAGPEREAALLRARRHWLLALCLLEEPAQRPCLVGIGGLPGTGKTTLALALAKDRGFVVIRSDVVRKERSGQPAYTEQAKDAVYTECLERATQLVLEGRQVIVDASFGRTRWRQMLLDRARELGVPAELLRCEVARETALSRLSSRQGDASDADPAVYERAVREWQGQDEAMSPVPTDGPGASERAEGLLDDMLARMSPPRP
jgi:aminoglycoside phosphotransferase family enzyme/predicted kinase